MTFANSLFKLAKAVWWIVSASNNSPLIPIRSKVAVASEISKTWNPRFPAILVEVETQWFVVNPTITRSLIPLLSSRSFKSVPIKALFTSLSITGSPPIGLTSSLISNPAWDLCSLDNGFVQLWRIWKIGRLSSLHFFNIIADLCSASLLFLFPPQYSSSSKPFWISINSNAGFFFLNFIGFILDMTSTTTP